MAFSQKYKTILNELSPELYAVLKAASTVDTARADVIRYLQAVSLNLYRDEDQTRSLEWYLQIRCVQSLRDIFSLRSAALAHNSALETLYYYLRDDVEHIPESLSDAFFEDLFALIKGMLGVSNIYDSDTEPVYASMKGREAAIARSNDLDQLAFNVQKRIRSYTSGLDDEVIQRRKDNRARILRVFGASEEDFDDYRWHLKHVIRDGATLASLIDLSDSERRGIDQAKEARLPFGITPYYVMLMDKEAGRKRDHAVRAQVIPPESYVGAVVSHKEDTEYSLDFMREQDTSPVDLVTRRYPMICILKPYNTCSQICVYCQRNWEIDDVLMPQAMASSERVDQAIEWIKAHPSVTEVLITGGDPLVMSDQKFESILSRVAALPQVERIRIGSRMPVVLPQRFTDNLIEIFRKYHEPGKRELALVTHFEHSYEVSPESMAAIQKVRRLGMGVYNQAVFTVNNSRRYEMAALRRILRLIGVDSYYTFNTKGKEETRDYRVPMARLQQEIKEEARILPGLARTDEAVYNVPGLGKNYLRAEQNHSLLNILPNGSRVYEFHPWEKNLSRAATYVDTDVPILEYLEELKRRGEDISEYRTIWYYL